MAYPAGSNETTIDGVQFVETKFILNQKELRIKTNLQTGNADFYLITPLGDQIIASTDSGNNWNVVNSTNLSSALENVPNNLINTQQKQNSYFSSNYTLNLNNLRAQVLNTKYPDGTQSTFQNTPGYGNNKNSSSGQNTPQSSNAPATGVLGGLFDFLDGGLPEVGDFADPKNPAFAKDLYYPIDILRNRQDTLHITQYKYKSPNQDIFKSSTSDILNKGLTKNSVLKERLGKVVLPMPNVVNDSNNVKWGGDEMNAFTTAAASTIIQKPAEALAALGGGQALGQLAKSLGINQSLGTNAPPAILRAYLGMQGGINNASTLAALYSFILSKYQFDVSPESILSRGLGVVPNSNLQLLFNNVTLRNFNFTYTLSPRSENEALDVNMILRFFKQGMAAKKKEVQAGAGSLYLGTPNVFKLEYKTDGNSSINGVNKFKICALTGFAVNYSPRGQWMAYDKGQPASVVMTMQFNELEPIYDTDYQENPSRDDLESITSKDIGY